MRERAKSARAVALDTECDYLHAKVSRRLLRKRIAFWNTCMPLHIGTPGVKNCSPNSSFFGFVHASGSVIYVVIFSTLRGYGSSVLGQDFRTPLPSTSAYCAR